MKTRKGPYGYFAIYCIKNNMQPIYNYALNIIENNLKDGILTAFDEDKTSGLEISYDFSGLLSLNEKSVISADKKLRRNAIGDFFENVIGMMDILLPPDRIVLDPDYIYFDENSNSIKICYLPIETGFDNEISSLGADRLETLLDHPFFSSSLSDDERSTLIYSVKTNDETMFSEAISSIRNPMTVTKKTKPDISFYLITALAFLVLILSSFFLDRIYTLILGIAFIGYLVKVLINRKRSASKTEPEVLKNERTKILFEKDPDIIDNESNLFSFASLESLSDKNAYGLYASETKIGSDRFLADIHIEDPKISALQAKLIHEDNSFYIIDCSQRNNTYLEDRSLIKEKKYEIKNGQKVTFGEKSFLFRAN